MRHYNWKKDILGSNNTKLLPTCLIAKFQAKVRQEGGRGVVLTIGKGQVTLKFPYI